MQGGRPPECWPCSAITTAWQCCSAKEKCFLPRKNSRARRRPSLNHSLQMGRHCTNSGAAQASSSAGLVAAPWRRDQRTRRCHRARSRRRHPHHREPSMRLRTPGRCRRNPMVALLCPVALLLPLLPPQHRRHQRRQGAARTCGGHAEHSSARLSRTISHQCPRPPVQWQEGVARPRQHPQSPRRGQQRRSPPPPPHAQPMRQYPLCHCAQAPPQQHP